MAAVERALTQHRLRPGQLVVEITERVPITDLGKGRRLRDMGVQVAVDDFGAGYDSLTNCTRCRWTSSSRTGP